jgi:hypothetical protein
MRVETCLGRPHTEGRKAIRHSSRARVSSRRGPPAAPNKKTGYAAIPSRPPGPSALCMHLYKSEQGEEEDRSFAALESSSLANATCKHMQPPQACPQETHRKYSLRFLAF